MVPIPSLTVAGNLKEVIGELDDDELTEEAIDWATLEFQSNVPNDAWIKWNGELKRLGVIRGRFDSDGNVVNEDGGLLKLVAQDDGLNIRGLQWRCSIKIPNSVIPLRPAGMMRSFWFNATGDGTTVNLSSVVPAVATELSGVTTPFTPYFEPVPGTDPQMYQAYDPQGNPVGDPFILSATPIGIVDGGTAAGSGTDTIDGGSA